MTVNTGAYIFVTSSDWSVMENSSVAAYVMPTAVEPQVSTPAVSSSMKNRRTYRSSVLAAFEFTAMFVTLIGTGYRSSGHVDAVAALPARSCTYKS